MASHNFPTLPLNEWRSTRDTLHGYCKVLGKIRRALATPQKHWWHISLRVTESGLTTAAIPVPERNAEHFDISLDLETHRLMITNTWGVWWEMPVNGQPPQTFGNQVLAALETMQIFLAIDLDELTDIEVAYDLSAVDRFWKALSSTHAILQLFKSELPGETSQVQLWPHHFDLSLMWLSGRKVPGVDRQNEEYADEQMSFGFSTGDEGIPDPYYYITAYPWPEEMTAEPLPSGAEWHTTQGWKGGLLMYQTVQEAYNPEMKLLHTLRAAYRIGASLMR